MKLSHDNHSYNHVIYTEKKSTSSKHTLYNKNTNNFGTYMHKRRAYTLIKKLTLFKKNNLELNISFSRK